jgi:LPPG:FO 2-phospho-L-lactate transferase
MARGLLAAVGPKALSVITNVGDDDLIYGLRVCPDLDTVVYTLAHVEGPHGWGLAGDTLSVMERLGHLGEDVFFGIGDADLATNLFRTAGLSRGDPLSLVTARIASAHGIHCTILPASDDPVRTRLLTDDGTWLDFQDYFVRRSQQDHVVGLAFEGAAQARPAPGVIEAVAGAAVVVIAPSNPVLSIWPILAVPGIRAALESAHRVAAVSPLFAGKALKGPADRVMESLGLPPGNDGILAAYEGLLTDLVVDAGDAADVERLGPGPVRIHSADIRIADQPAATRLARWLVSLP